MRTALFLVASVLGAFLLFGGCAGDDDSMTQAGEAIAFEAPITWTDTDWSQSGSYQSATGIEPRSSPGDVVLASNPSDMRVMVSPSDPEGWLPRNFYPLAVHNGKLFAGYGGPPEGDVEGYDPHPGHEFAEIWRYDPASGVPMARQATVDEQGIVIIKNRGGQLFSPGVDAATEQGPNWGNLYKYDGVQWHRYHNLPWSAHVYDFEIYNGKWFATNYNWQGPAQVLVSADGGQSWQVSLQMSVGRMYALGVFGGNLFAQPRAVGVGANKIMKFDGTTWTETAAPNMPYNPSGESLGRFAEHAGKFYFTTLGYLYRLIPAENRWEQLYCPGYWGAGSWPMGFASMGGYLYHSAGYETLGVRFYRTLEPGLGPESWEQVADGFQQQPYGNYEKIRDFTMFRGRIHLCTTNPIAESQGGAIYVAAAASSGTLTSNPHDFGVTVTSGMFTCDALREMSPATVARFQVRSAATRDGLNSVAFTGPNGSPSTYYAGGEALASVNSGKRWFQYRMELSTNDARYTPSVSSVTITANGGTPPKKDLAE